MASPTLEIRQLTAPLLTGRRPMVVSVTGTAGPVGTIAWGGKHAHQKTRAAGSGVATIYADGPEENDTPFTFDWKGRTLRREDAVVDGNPVRSVEDLKEAFDQMRIDGVLVEVTWRGTARVGFVAEFVAVEGKLSEYIATLTVTWTKTPRWPELRFYQTREPAKSLADRMRTSWDATLASVNKAVTMAGDVVQDVDDAAADIDTRLDALVNAANDAGRVADDARSADRAVAEALIRVSTVATEVRTALERPAGRLALSNEPTAQLRARLWQAEVAAAARAQARAAALARKDFEPAAEDILAVHLATEGETVWFLSWVWYGHNGGAHAIMARNGLVQTTLRTNQRVLIPRSPDGQ